MPLETLELCESFGAEENLLCFGEVGELEKQFLELFTTAGVLFATLKNFLLIVWVKIPIRLRPFIKRVLRRA